MAEPMTQDYPTWWRLGDVYVPVTTPSGARAVVALSPSMRGSLRLSLAEYRRWGNGPVTATTVAAAAAEAVAHLDRIAKLCDTLLDALDGHPWPSATEAATPAPDATEARG